jgi:hypothetical protein
MLQWARCRYHKKRIGTRYAELLFLHLVQSACREVDSGVSGPQNVDALLLKVGSA